MFKINKSIYFLPAILLGFFLYSFFGNLTVDAQGRTCCSARTGSPSCDYCSGAATKTSTSVPASEGADYYGCGGNTSGGFIQYDSGNNAICRVCPTNLPYSLACGLPGPPAQPPTPVCGGACTTNSQCPLVDGRVRSVCHPTLHICVNPFCPNSSELGAQCYCNAPAVSQCGSKCGNWPEGKYPLCAAGSGCAPLNGPFCTLVNTYCLPYAPATGYTRPACISYPSYAYLVRPNGTMANTQADVLAACATCLVAYPGAATLTYPANNAVVNLSATPGNVTTAFDTASSGWGKGCPLNTNTWTLKYSVNGAAEQSITSATIPNLPGGATVTWHVVKSNGSLTMDSPVFRFTTVASCAATAPNPATLTSPADGDTIPLGFGSSVNVTYNTGTTTDWGACSTTGTASVEISVVTLADDCIGKTFTTSATPIPGLAVDDKVCWRVVKTNAGSLSATSATWSFIVGAEQKPWMLGYNGDVSAGSGVSGFAVPNGLKTLSATLNDRNNNQLLNDLNSPFTSSYSLLSGTAAIPSSSQSRMNQYTTGYEDLSINPPQDAGIPKWYDYIYDAVTRNAVGAISTYTGDQVLGTNSSTLAGIPANTKKHVLINGNLTVAASSKCDTQTIFFVTGTITFTPDFTIDTAAGKNKNTNGCLFVARGDITIKNEATDKANPSIAVNSSQLANYDVIEAGLVTDSLLVTNKYVPSAAEKGDGLYIKGSVTSFDVKLQNDINTNANQLQPANVFRFDPRYREIFKGDLNYTKYSFRETGFTN